MDLQAMTKEKLQFKLPVVFTIGPDVNQRGANSPLDDDADDVQLEDRGDALVKYVMLLADSGTGGESEHVSSIVKGIIEGETRVLVSSMTMEEIFTEREVFKKRIFRNIQGELHALGLKIYNSNVSWSLCCLSTSTNITTTGQRAERCPQFNLLRIPLSQGS